MSKRKKRVSTPSDVWLGRSSGTRFDPDVRTGMDSGTASAGECTGLIPSGGDLTEDEFESRKDLFPFADPDILPK